MYRSNLNAESPQSPLVSAASPEAPPDEGAAVVSIRTGLPVDPVHAERRQRDRKLVEAILAGDAEAFTELHTLYSQRLYRFAIKRLGDATEAEDVVQDVFLEVHRCLGAWEGRSALVTWMFGITHHQICRRFRRKTPISVPVEQLEVAPTVAPEPPSDRRIDAIRILEVCFATLQEDVSPAQHEIFDRYYGQNQPMKQIASDLGKSNQAIKISLFRTRRAIEARLEQAEILRMA